MTARRAHILVVDDEPLLRDLLVDILESSGHHAVAAIGGEEALAALQSQQFDLLISDIKMPGMTGFELLAHARQHWPTLPVVLVSAFATEASVTHAEPDGFLSKPFRISQIEELIGRMLRSGRALPGPSTAPKSEPAVQPID